MRCLMMTGLFLAMCVMSVLSRSAEAQNSYFESRTTNIVVTKSIVESKTEEVTAALVPAVFADSECYAKGCAGSGNYELIGADNQKTQVTCNYEALGVFRPAFCYNTQRKGAKCKTYIEGAAKTAIGDVRGEKVTCEGYYEVIIKGQVEPGKVKCKFDFTVCYSTEYPPFESEK